jgi:superfamily II DNA/RNA helicase
MFTGAVPQDPNATDVSFSDLGLSDPIVQSLAEMEFEHPTPIQAQGVPLALAGKDIIGLAQTGSGKTAAFGLPMAEKLQHGQGIRGLILAPTREIAMQTKGFLDVVGRDHQLEMVILIGGVPIGPQIDTLKKHPDIIVATPGRLWDHCQRRTLKLDKIEMLVLDEADHMLDLGFLPQIQRILQVLPKEHQTLMFSATMPPSIDNLVQRFMQDPELIDLRPAKRMATGIEHRLYMVSPADKRACMMALADEEEGSMLVFLRRKVDTEWLYRHLKNAGHSVERIHSDRSQAQRVAALNNLRNSKHRILLATNIAARGIDIPVIEHIVNYSMPDTLEDYVHRAGRTARGAMQGTVSTIGTWQDREVIRQVEKTIGGPLPRCEAKGVEPYKELKKTIRGREKLRRRMW